MVPHDVLGEVLFIIPIRKHARLEHPVSVIALVYGPSARHLTGQVRAGDTPGFVFLFSGAQRARAQSIGGRLDPDRGRPRVHHVTVTRFRGVVHRGMVRAAAVATATGMTNGIDGRAGSLAA